MRGFFVLSVGLVPAGAVAVFFEWSAIPTPVHVAIEVIGWWLIAGLLIGEAWIIALRGSRNIARGTRHVD